jgi:hypothetical protein
MSLVPVVSLLWSHTISAYLESLPDCTRLFLTCKDLYTCIDFCFSSPKTLTISTPAALTPGLPLDMVSTLILSIRTRAMRSALTNWSALVLYGHQRAPCLTRLVVTTTPHTPDHTLYAYNILEAIVQGRFPKLAHLTLPFCTCHDGCRDDAVHSILHTLRSGACRDLVSIDLCLSCPETMPRFADHVLRAIQETRRPVCLRSFPQVMETPGIVTYSALGRLATLVTSGIMAVPDGLTIDTTAMPDDALRLVTSVLQSASTLLRLRAKVRPSPYLASFLRAVIATPTLNTVHLTFWHTPRPALDPSLVNTIVSLIPSTRLCTDSTSRWLHHELGR